MTNALTHLDISPLLVVATVVLGGAVAVNLRFKLEFLSAIFSSRQVCSVSVWVSGWWRAFES